MNTADIYRLKREQWIDRPLERLFPFFERPENLALITPPSLEFRLLTPGLVKMEQGRIIDYTIRVLGIRIRWRSIISTYQPPFCFVDEQLMGPYSYWHHCHRFRKSGNGTKMIDDVHYALPLYLPRLLREILHRWYVRPNLEQIFDYRERQYKKFFSSSNVLESPYRNNILMRN